MRELNLSELDAVSGGIDWARVAAEALGATVGAVAGLGLGPAGVAGGAVAGAAAGGAIYDALS